MTVQNLQCINYVGVLTIRPFSISRECAESLIFVNAFLNIN